MYKYKCTIPLNTECPSGYLCKEYIMDNIPGCEYEKIIIIKDEEKYE